MSAADLGLLQMDADSCNRCLYTKLLGMGFCVFPISAPDDPSRIDYLMVSAELPVAINQKVSEETAGTRVAKPVPRPVVGDVVGSPNGLGDNVVLMPSEGR